MQSCLSVSNLSDYQTSWKCAYIFWPPQPWTDKISFASLSQVLELKAYATTCIIFFFLILWITNGFDCLISGRTQHYFCVRRSKTWVLHIHYTPLRLTKPFMVVFTCFPRLLTIYQKTDERETHADRDFDSFVCLYTHMNKFTPVHMCRA